MLKIRFHMFLLAANLDTEDKWIYLSTVISNLCSEMCIFQSNELELLVYF